MSLRTAIIASLALFACTAATRAADPATTAIHTTATVNPDGTGKIVVDALIPLSGKEAKADIAKRLVATLVTSNKVTEAWKDVTFETTPDGRLHLIGTAYVGNIATAMAGMGPAIKLTHGDNGIFTLACAVRRVGLIAPLALATDNEVADKVQKAKAFIAAYQQTAAAAPPTEFSNTYYLPGRIMQAKVFSIGGQNSVSIAYGSQKYLEVLDKIVKDDRALAGYVRAGMDATDIMDEVGDPVLSRMFGQQGPASVSVTGADKPLFDYKAEMTAAKEAQPEMLRKLGL